MQKLMMLGQVMQQGQQLGVVGPEEFLNWFDDLCKAAGYRNPRRFSQEVQKDEQGNPKVPPPPKDPMVQVAEIKAQSDAQKAQFEAQGKGQELQMQSQADQMRMQNELTLQASNDQRQIELEKYKVDRQMELERFKAELKVQADLQIAQIKAAAERDSMAMKDEREDEEKTSIKSVTGLTERISEAVERLEAQANAPRRIVRGPDGKAIGVDVGGTVRAIERDQDGKAVGLH
jgi:hypothetical protein